MIKAKRGLVKIIGNRSEILAELSTIISTLAEKDLKGVMVAMAVGLKNQDDLEGIINELLEDDD